MQTPEEAIGQLETLSTEYTQLREEHERLKTRFDDLSAKLNSPGTRLLVDLQYKLVPGFPKTFTLTSLQHLIPGISDPQNHGPFDIRRDNQHAFYILSAKVQTSGKFIIYDGTTTSYTDCSIAYAAYNNNGSYETWLDIYNGTAGTVKIDVSLYRHIGIK